MTDDGEFGSVGSRFSLGLDGFGVMESRDAPSFFAALTSRDDTRREGEVLVAGECSVFCERFFVGLTFSNWVSNRSLFLLGEAPRDLDLCSRRS